MQTLMIDAYDELDGSNNYDEFYNKFYSLIGKNSFSMADMYADTYAYNIYKMLYDYSLTEAFEIYFQRGYNTRFKNFTNYWCEDKITSLVSIYTNNDYIIIHWPLFGSYNFKENQSKAAQDAFVKFLMERINNE